ncbi:MAG TPA: hypothetical protein VHE80_00110, partial [Acidimicrobiales bacterium]|nr:hypothetical protein [Acidimicrobiales bacterium]
GPTSSHPAFVAHFVAVHPFTALMVAWLLLVPVFPMLRGRRLLEPTPEWVIPREPGSGPVLWPRRPPLAVGAALRWGAVVGAVFCAAMLAAYALGISTSDLIRPFRSFHEAAFQYAHSPPYAPIALAVVAQVTVAAVVALRAERVPVIHALWTVPATVVLTTAGVVAPHVIDRGALPSDAWTTARLLLGAEAIAALLAGTAVFGLRRMTVRAFEHPRLPSWTVRGGLDPRSTR